MFFFFNDTATTEIYTLSLHDALPISGGSGGEALGLRLDRKGGVAVERLGFVGLGAMGSPMAMRLAGAGLELRVFDVFAERTRPLVERGAASAASPQEAAEGTEALVLMVANADQAEGALFGEGGAAESLPEGAAVVVMSTIGPEAVRALADGLAEGGLRTVDAPVGGGGARAEGGGVLIM